MQTALDLLSRESCLVGVKEVNASVKEAPSVTKRTDVCHLKPPMKRVIDLRWLIKPTVMKI